MIWAHVQRGTVNTHYTPDMIKWEEVTPAASHSVTPRQQAQAMPALAEKSGPLPPGARPRTTVEPRLKQHAISPARLGHSIHINKTGFPTEVRASTARSTRRGFDTTAPELSWWSFTATGPKKSERPVSCDAASARMRHRLERSEAWKGAERTVGDRARTQELPMADDSLNTVRDSTLHTQAAMHTQAFVKSFMAITDKRFTSKGESTVESDLNTSKKSQIVAQMPIAQMKLAQTLDRLSAPSKRRGRARQNVQDKGPEQSPEEIQLEQQKKKLKEHTIRRVIAGDGYQEYEGDSRLPADRQSTYAMDELAGRELTSTEKSNITGVFREVMKNSEKQGPNAAGPGAEQRKEGRDAKAEEENVRGPSGAVISWNEVAKTLRGRLSNAHVQRLGVYFGLKGLKGKIRQNLYVERLGLLVTASPERRLRIAFGLLDVGGDGVIGRRDIFAALAATRFEDPGFTVAVTAVFTAPGAYGVHFAESDTPSLLVVDVVAESPAEKQGVRLGSRLAKINGMHVDRLSCEEVRALLMNPARPMSMTFRSRPQEPTDSTAGIIDPADLKRLLKALRMDFVTRRVKILVAHAKNLKSPDQHFTSSQPYCQVEVEGKPRTRWQTKPLQEMDPKWEEEREIADFTMGEKLKFTVRDKDFGTKEDDILGMALLPSSRFQDATFEGEIPLYQDENMRQKTNSLLSVRVTLSGEGGIGLADFEKVFHDGEPSFLQKLQEVMTGCVQRGKAENQIQPVKIQVSFLSATGLRNADTAAYAACETHNKAKFDKIRPKSVSESLDLVAIGSEKPQAVEYMPGEALRFAVFDGPKAENAEPLGSCIFPSERFWPAGFEGTLQLADEHSRRDKKSNVVLKIKVATPESSLPHQFAAAAVKEPTGTNGLERFEAEMKELRARMPFLTEADFTWHIRVFDALRDEDWLVQRARLITSADKIFGIPVGYIAGRLFESVSPKGQPVGVLDWGMFLQRHRGDSWDAKQERQNLTFTLYDLDGDGMLSLADAISLSTEVVRLEKIYGEESNSIQVCEEMRWLYGLIANAADGGRDGGRLDLQVFKQLRPEPSIMHAMLKCLDALAKTGPGPSPSLKGR